MLPLNLVLRRIHKHIEETKLLKKQHQYLFLAPGFSIILQLGIDSFSLKISLIIPSEIPFLKRI